VPKVAGIVLAVIAIVGLLLAPSLLYLWVSRSRSASRRYRSVASGAGVPC
jgi:hypothetical protein